MEMHAAGFVASPSFAPHDHTNLGEAEFHFFMGGAGRVRNGDIETAYVPGSLFYTPAGVKHEAWGSKPTGFFFFRFTWEPADAELQAAVERRFADAGRVVPVPGTSSTSRRPSAS